MRQRRAQDFQARRTLFAFSISQDLCNDAFQLLARARSERPEPYEPEDGGHYAESGPSSILLVTTAFDQWLNNIAFALSVRFPQLRDFAARLPTAAKHAAYITTISERTTEENRNLRMAFHVRDEIVHWLPRTDDQGSYWPEWLAELMDKGLVLHATPPHTTIDGVDLTGKLHSYRLALWVWRTLDTASRELLAAFSEDDRVLRNIAETGSEGFLAHAALPD
jgi:hypothetical protein